MLVQHARLKEDGKYETLSWDAALESVITVDKVAHCCATAAPSSKRCQSCVPHSLHSVTCLQIREIDTIRDNIHTKSPLFPQIGLKLRFGGSEERVLTLEICSRRRCLTELESRIHGLLHQKVETRDRERGRRSYAVTEENPNVSVALRPPGLVKVSSGVMMKLYSSAISHARVSGQTPILCTWVRANIPKLHVNEVSPLPAPGTRGPWRRR